MKKNWKGNIRLAILFSWLFLSACNRNADHAEHETYTCPMHPTVVSDRPGACPVCGMDLVRKARPGEAVEITKDLSDAIKAPDQSVISTVETINPEYKSLPIVTKAVGVVTYDTRNVYTIPSRVGGRIEKMDVKYEFQRLTKGQKIAEIYSPELITAQRELLYLIEHDPENTALIDGAKSRLTRMGFSITHIQELVLRKEAGNTFSVYSPYDGYAIARNTRVPVSPDIKNAMNSMDPRIRASGETTTPPSVTSLSVREGNYVSPGQTLISVVNTNAIRIELDLSQEVTRLLKEGDKLEIDLGNGNKEHAVVDFVQPFFNKDQNFLKIRVNFKNRQNFNIGQLVKTTIALKAKEALWVPRQSVVDLGIDKIVFIKQQGTFKPTKITTGISTDEWLEVKTGLATSDQIAADAHYLVDSESFIKTAN